MCEGERERESEREKKREIERRKEREKEREREIEREREKERERERERDREKREGEREQEEGGSVTSWTRARHASLIPSQVFPCLETGVFLFLCLRYGPKKLEPGSGRRL